MYVSTLCILEVIISISHVIEKSYDVRFGDETIIHFQLILYYPKKNGSSLTIKQNHRKSLHKICTITVVPEKCTDYVKKPKKYKNASL